MRSDYNVSIFINTIMEKLIITPDYQFCHIKRRTTILGSEVIEVFSSELLRMRLVFHEEDDVVLSVMMDDQCYDAHEIISQIEASHLFFGFRVNEIIHQKDFGYYDIKLLND